MNQFSKEHISVASNASGRKMHVPVYRFKGQAPGPKVYIQSSIHGAEVQGNVVIYHLIEFLKVNPIRGEIVLVPNCNPVGTNIKSGEYTLGRFDPVNGQNWNRGYYYDESMITEFVDSLTGELSLEEIKPIFKEKMKQAIESELNKPWGIGLASRLNLQLQSLALDADIVIDLHNGPVATRHIYVPEYAKESARYFNIPHIIYIPNQFSGALDEATFCHWWTLVDKLSVKFPAQLWETPVEAFTLEMGSQEVIDFESGQYDANGILSYLNHKGFLVESDIEPDNINRYSVFLKDYKILYSQDGGIVEYKVKPGQHVNKGEVIANVLNVDELENENAVSHIYAPDDLIVILHFPSASVLCGTQLYKCFVNYTKL
ncbi:MAG: succinylglutamate desuccinylase/aspartoacylase family protein [Kangiellaceae bacterium]|nr:succinylglutamate desuccinylase/aspartoacylase family protein [Kangiellaceae bacterium]